MIIIDSYEKLNKPGLWFVCSIQPTIDLRICIYELVVELGLPVVVYSSTSQKVIQNAIISQITKKCVDTASNELERYWLEGEMSEYNTHGQFWYPEELNDYLPDNPFWSNYIHFDQFKILSFTNNFSNLYLIDNLCDLWYNDEKDLSKSFLSIEGEAVENKKTIIIFVSSYDFDINEDYIKNHLLM